MKFVLPAFILIVVFVVSDSYYIVKEVLIMSFQGKEKQQLYKTAYSPLFDCFVGIEHAHKDDLGSWIFRCFNKEAGLEGHLFREHELQRFCL